MRSRSRVVATALAGVLVLAAAACSGDDDSGSASNTTTSSATTTSTTVATTTTSSTTASTVPPTTGTTEPCAPPVNGSVAPQTSTTPSDVMVYKAVTVTTEHCTDTVQFAFASGTAEKPGYRIEYQQGPFTEDASGKPVTIAGSAFLVVRMEPATGFDFLKNELAYKGPSRIPAKNGAFVTEVVRTGDFESVTTWIIGLREQVPFSVDAQGAPDHQLTISIG
jgi:hypothetical protein